MRRAAVAPCVARCPSEVSHGKLPACCKAAEVAPRLRARRGNQDQRDEGFHRNNCRAPSRAGCDAPFKMWNWPLGTILREGEARRGPIRVKTDLWHQLDIVKNGFWRGFCVMSTSQRGSTATQKLSAIIRRVLFGPNDPRLHDGPR